MLLPKTLFLYLTRNFLFYISATTGIISVSIFLVGIFDSISKLKNNLSPYKFIYFSLLKLPYLISELFPLLILISLIFMYENLSKKNEMVVIFSSGISVWKLLQPLLLVGVSLGIFVITIIQPYGAYCLEKQSYLEKKYNNRQNNKVFGLSDSGIYLYEQTGDQRRIISASYVFVAGKKLENISILFFDDQNNYSHRIEAKDAVFKENKISFSEDAYEINASGIINKKISKEIETSIDIDTIIKKFDSPETISFWKLQDLSNTLSNSGINSDKFINYYYKLLCRPLYVIAITILSTCFLAINPRARYGFKSLGIAGVIGLLIHSSREIGGAYLVSQGITSFSAQLIPAIILMTISTIILLSKFE